MSVPRREARGFTMVELIVTMILIGILAAVALPRFANRLTFDTRRYADQVSATLRYGQKVAIAQRQRVQATVAAGNVSLNFCTVAAGDACTAATTGCAGAIVNPAGGATYSIDAPSGVLLSPVTTFRFDCLGRPMSSDTAALATTAFSVTGDGTIGIVVETETGYVH